MSLILEALRKSEAERRRGQTPDLLTDAMPVAPAARRALPNWTVLLPVIGAALITLLLVAWWLRPSAEPVSHGDAANGASASDASARAPEAAAPPLNPATVRAQPSLTPPVMQPSVPAATATKAVALPANPTTEPPTATARNRTSPAATEPQPALAMPAQVASAGQAGTAPVLADAPVFASPDAPVKLSDLSAEDREQLPVLKVSMHMWSPDAGNRFAIIDGTRVNEGDRVGEATIEAIRQDSVMLSWRGRQIRLQIR
jgi:general secretion pathway protein B